MIADKMTIAARLAKLRRDRTQREVAKALNISVSALGMYECGQRVPRDEVKAKIASYYHASIESLFFTP